MPPRNGKRRPTTVAVRPSAVPLAASAAKLNLACGSDIRPRADGWTNMDVVPLEGVDVVHSATTFPWPFPDDAFDHVLISHYLEHVPHNLGNGSHQDGFLQVMEELHRVVRPGGTIEVFVPHWRSEWTWRDPTHTRAVHPDNFLYVTDDGPHGFYSTARFRIRVREVTQWGAPWPNALPIGKGRYGLFQHVLMRARWALRPFRPMLPPLEMHFVLECRK